ncbi:MAG: UDP-glucose/GDP-mannose dehydrogenase family protein [Pseudomonadota bacterium]
MKVSIFGSGYVGLVTGACFADSGNDVVCVDVDQAKIDGLNNGVVPIYEPGLDTLIERNMQAGRLRFTTDAAMAVEHGLFQFIAVGTPPDEDGSADLTYVLEVARTVASHMGEHKILVNKSTVPVGTADLVREAVSETLAQRGVEAPFDVVSNPEFLKEGAAIDDCMRPDRIVVGIDNGRARQEMHDLYAPFVKRNEDVIIFMDVRSAELTKYAANAMLATKISFMNELANIAERVGADIEHIRHGIGSDRRIGYHFIYAGAGYGGSCFPKDVTALHRTARAHDYEAEILNAVEAVNDRQKNTIFQRLHDHFGGDLTGKTIAVWGLAFKPNTDDMREAPSRRLMEQLWASGAKVRAYDPEAMDECRRIYGDRDDLVLVERSMDAIEGADALAVVTEWKAFWNPDFDAVRGSLSAPVIVDGRNIFDPQRMEEAGFDYYSIGRQPIGSKVSA